MDHATHEEPATWLIREILKGMDGGIADITRYEHPRPPSRDVPRSNPLPIAPSVGHCLARQSPWNKEVTLKKLALPHLMMGYLAIVATSATMAGPTTGPISWRTQYAAARQEAQKNGKLLLVNIHTSWCGPCRALQRTTLQDPRLAQMIQTYSIPLSLDGDANSQLLSSWGVNAFPTQLIFSPTGQLVGKFEGHVGVSEYMGHVQRAVAVAQIQPVGKPASASASSPMANVKTATPPFPRANSQVAKAGATVPATQAPGTIQQVSYPLALDGHCPVSMLEKAEMVPGSRTFAAVYQGRRYQFRTSRERELFQSSPNKYLPAMQGICVVSLIEDGKNVAGQLKFPAIFNEQLFLFANRECQRRFLLDPERYVDHKGNVQMQAVRDLPDGNFVR